jgi:hypothetical protein
MPTPQGRGRAGFGATRSARAPRGGAERRAEAVARAGRAPDVRPRASPCSCLPGSSAGHSSGSTSAGSGFYHPGSSCSRRTTGATWIRGRPGVHPWHGARAPARSGADRLARVTVVFGRPLDPRSLARQDEGGETRDRIANALRYEVAKLGRAGSAWRTSPISTASEVVTRNKSCLRAASGTSAGARCGRTVTGPDVITSPAVGAPS